MYNKLVKQAMLKAGIQFLIMTGFVYCIHFYFRSNIITLIFFFTLFTIRLYLLFKPKASHAKSLEKLESVGDFIEGYKKKALDKNLEYKWEKGIGSIDELKLVMWSNVSEEGIELLIVSRSSKGTYLIPWRNIQLLVPCYYNQGEISLTLIRMSLSNSDIKICSPWRESFNDFVPDFVSSMAVKNGLLIDG